MRLDLLEVFITLGLIAAPLAGAVVGAVVGAVPPFRSALRPYLRATAWMWGLAILVATIAALTSTDGFIPTDTPTEGAVAFLIYGGITLAFLWPWFVVPAAQIVHSLRGPA